MPSKRESISMVACVEEDSVRLARSHCVRRRRIARWLPAMSLPRFLRLGQKSSEAATFLENPCKYSAKSLEVLDAEIHHSVVEVLTAQVGVASGGLRLVFFDCLQMVYRPTCGRLPSHHRTLRGGTFTSKMPSSMVRSETSKVPPPMSCVRD